MHKQKQYLSPLLGLVWPCIGTTNFTVQYQGHKLLTKPFTSLLKDAIDVGKKST